MPRRRFLKFLRLGLCLLGFPGAPLLSTAGEPLRRTWQVDGITREALVVLPQAVPSKNPGQFVPLLFIFHGHGGTMRHAARTMALHTHWPEALCVYPQGLPTIGRLTDPEGKKSGWQAQPGDYEDRDLKFFDAILAALRAEQSIDSRRIHATGHSNGGAFTYLLLGQRGDILASIAPSAAIVPLRQFKDLKPKPVLHLAGKNDPLVRFAWQEATLVRLRRINGCDPSAPLITGLNTFPSKTGNPVQAFIHPGGHEFPAQAPVEIVRFLKNDTKPGE